jgi:hypothetical protein
LPMIKTLQSRDNILKVNWRCSRRKRSAYMHGMKRIRNVALVKNLTIVGSLFMIQI